MKVDVDEYLADEFLLSQIQLNNNSSKLNKVRYLKNKTKGAYQNVKEYIVYLIYISKLFEDI